MNGNEHRQNASNDGEAGDPFLSPTPYTLYIWGVATNPETPLSDRHREGLKARITLDSQVHTSPAFAQALAQAGGLEQLDGGRIRHIVLETARRARSTVVALSEEERRAVALFEAQHRLQALERGILDEGETFNALTDFVELGYESARAEVERLLSSAIPALRVAALETLLVYWQLSEYEEVARDFLRDPSTQCREWAIDYLGGALERSADLRTLDLLAQRANDPHESDKLRLDAYCALLAVAGYPIVNHRQMREIADFPYSGRSFEDIRWVDRGLLAFLGQGWHERDSDRCVVRGSVHLRYPWNPVHALSTDGRLLACLSFSYEAEYALEVWDLRGDRYHLLSAEGRRVAQASEHAEEKEGEDGIAQEFPYLTDLLCWSHDGTRLAVAQADGGLDVWLVTWEGQECERIISYRAEEGFSALAWGNRSYCLAAATPSALLCWDASGALRSHAYPSFDEESTLATHEHIGALVFSPDDTWLLTGDSGGKLYQWSTQSWSSFTPGWWWYSNAQGRRISRMTCSPGGERVAVYEVVSNEMDGVVAEGTSIITLGPRHAFRFGETNISDLLGWSRDGRQLVTVRYDDNSLFDGAFVELFDAQSGALVESIKVDAQVFPEWHGYHFETFSAVLAPDGNHVHWCVHPQRWAQLGGSGDTTPRLCYGSLRFSPEKGGAAFRLVNDFSLRETAWQWQGFERWGMGDEELALKALAPSLRVLRAALKRGDTVSLAFHIRTLERSEDC